MQVKAKFTIEPMISHAYVNFCLLTISSEDAMQINYSLLAAKLKPERFQKQNQAQGSRPLYVGLHAVVESVLVEGIICCW